VSEFIQANREALIARGVPPKLTEDALSRLDAQNRGELPTPLEGEDLHIVRSAWAWMTAKPTVQNLDGELQ
jgi:hypothetical protein